MSSYCDIKKLETDAANHPNFTNRLNTWKNGPNGVNGCTVGAANCLSDAEVACYANYMLSSKRRDLDASLQSIHQPQNAPAASFDSNYNATMLTCVVWAMLGTTVLYYAFTKI